jgi:predicted membrane channel-forming protein YqfA (hemolysin III family)
VVFCCACRRRRTAAGKLWGASMLGVCGASITFHVSSGKWRDLGRKLDYW